ncbi:MAG: 50S ribosomal protein L18 [bacterium]|nr:50S ribosomal protein L18 [bacterium]
MNLTKTKRDKRIRRHARVRAEIKGTSERPRLSVFRSNHHIWVQLVDDVTGTTLASATDWEKPAKGKKSAKKETRVARAEHIGERIATYAAEKKITAFVFDRGGNKYHGRVKAVAEGARKAGIQF